MSAAHAPGASPLGLSPDDERRVAVYVARIARLDAASWGRLDAIGERLAGGSPIARWRRAQLDADVLALTRLLDPTLATTPSLTGGALLDTVAGAGALWRTVAGRRDDAAGPPPATGHDERTPPDVAARQERLGRHVAAFHAALRSQPGRGPGAGHAGHAGRCLDYGFRALLARPLLTAERFRRLYDVVEPVIPLASLDEGPTTRALPPASPAGG